MYIRTYVHVLHSLVLHFRRSSTAASRGGPLLLLIVVVMIHWLLLLVLVVLVVVILLVFLSLSIYIYAFNYICCSWPSVQQQAFEDPVNNNIKC